MSNMCCPSAIVSTPTILPNLTHVNYFGNISNFFINLKCYKHKIIKMFSELTHRNRVCSPNLNKCKYIRNLILLSLKYLISCVWVQANSFY